MAIILSTNGVKSKDTFHGADMELPKPPPAKELRADLGLMRQVFKGYTAADIDAHGMACARVAMERAAQICEQVNATTGECPELALYCADAIRAAIRKEPAERIKRIIAKHSSTLAALKDR